MATEAGALLRSRKSAAHGGHFVAIGIAHICRIEILAVLRPQVRYTFTHAAICKSRRMEAVDRFPRRSTECHHVSVAHRGGLLIERFADPECELAAAVLLINSPTG